MLISNLFVAVTWGAVVYARAVEKSDRSFQRPINDPSSYHPATSPQCVFRPSLPILPASYISTLPTSLHHHLPNILLSRSMFSTNFPLHIDFTLPVLSTLSLLEETGDSSLQGVYLGLVYTPTGKSGSKPPSIPPLKQQESKTKPKCRRPPPTFAVKDEQEIADESWGHFNHHEIRSPISSVPESTPSLEMRRCFTEAVEGVRESGLVEGTLEFLKEGGRFRFLVWRVD